MRHRKKGPGFGIFYGLALTAVTAFVLLDTFVIPHTITVVASESEASAYTSAAASSGTDSSDSTDSSSSGSADSTVSSDSGSSDSEDSGSNSDSADSGSSSGSADSTATDSTATDSTSSDAVITDTSYSDDNITITLTTKRVSNTDVYIADIQISDISYLKTALAQASYGRNIKETTSTIAEENNAILAINGDYYGFRNSGYVLRNGVLYRNTSSGAEDLVILSDGSFELVDEDSVTAEELADEGALQILSFGPGLVDNGEIIVDDSDEVDQARTSNPRTAIGIISPLHYLFVVSDGRTSENDGLTLKELAAVMQDAGAEVAYNLDGGGSTTMYFNGEVVNNPTSGHGISERKVSDIVYIGY